MRIKIGDNLRHAIANEFAGWVHAEVVGMHLRVSYGIHPADNGPCYVRMNYQKERLQEMRQFVRSIRDNSERRMFCMTVKCLFTALRKRHRTYPKWQDYVASVRAHVATLKEAA